MPQRIKDAPFRAIIERFTGELTAAIAQHIQHEVSQAVARAVASVGDARRSGRLCPVPGCGKTGAGPRNRWFCKEHSGKLSATEQKSILERNKRLAEEGKLPTAIPAQRVVRLPPKGPRARRALDMSCRVEGCPNRSRGPRAGFICDQHRAELSAEEQKAARDVWNQKHKGKASTPVDVSPKHAAPVPPILRKAEPAEA